MANLDFLSAEAKGWLVQATTASAAGKWAEAEAAYKRVVAVEPRAWPVFNELGNLLLNLARAEEAERHLRQVVELQPDFAPGWSNLGNALCGMERREEAKAAYLKALALQPDLAAAEYNLSMVYLAQGQMEEGWVRYEKRWQSEMAQAQRDWAAPRWTGEQPIEGRTIWVHAEQGLGDTLQFSRYVNALLGWGAQVTLAVQAPLLPLMRHSFPAARVVAKNAPEEPTDFQIPLLSLPLACLRRGVSWQSEVPYLQAEVGRREKWRARLPVGQKRVGLVWSANVRHWRGFLRNVGPLPFAQVLAHLPVQPVALTKELRPQDVAAARVWPNLGPLLEDFADTAALIAELDLVLTVDTSVAHLAGAMGKPVWIWLAKGADWRWFEGRADSPYYPSARLFRQEKAGDWTAPAAAMRRALEAWSR